MSFLVPQYTIMRYIKKLQNFSLIFLHPLECPKCIAAEKINCCNDKPNLPITLAQTIRNLNKKYQDYETLYNKVLPPSKYLLRKLSIKRAIKKCDLNTVPLLSHKKVLKRQITKGLAAPISSHNQFLPTKKRIKKLDILNQLEDKISASKTKFFNGFADTPQARKVREITKKNVLLTPIGTQDLSHQQPKKQIQRITSKKKSPKSDKVLTKEVKKDSTVTIQRLPSKQKSPKCDEVLSVRETKKNSTIAIQRLPCKKKSPTCDKVLSVRKTKNNSPVTNQRLPSKKKSPKYDKVLSVKETKKNSPVTIQRLPSKKKSPKYDKELTTKEAKKNFSVKKQRASSSKESSAEKAPGKGTLKRKRWLREKLNDSNENHEDDMFENQKSDELITKLFENDTDKSDDFELLKTPVFPFSLSPCEKTPSPTYRDCYSPTDLTESRNGAEEYRFRKDKKWKKELFPKNKKISPKDIKKDDNDILKEVDVQKTLEAVAKILDETQEKMNDSESDDDYYPDLFKPDKPDSSPASL